MPCGQLISLLLLLLLAPVAFARSNALSALSDGQLVKLETPDEVQATQLEIDGKRLLRVTAVGPAIGTSLGRWSNPALKLEDIVAGVRSTFKMSGRGQTFGNVPRTGVLEMFRKWRQWLPLNSFFRLGQGKRPSNTQKASAYEQSKTFASRFKERIIAFTTTMKVPWIDVRCFGLEHVHLFPHQG
uniref:Uncharacterized protein n=1 Tax=Peronospora matthiolae TaxID=2874970 RepID=A0AAV1U4Q9_9STRA